MNFSYFASLISLLVFVVRVRGGTEVAAANISLARNTSDDDFLLANATSVSLTFLANGTDISIIPDYSSFINASAMPDVNSSGNGSLRSDRLEDVAVRSSGLSTEGTPGSSTLGQMSLNWTAAPDVNGGSNGPTSSEHLEDVAVRSSGSSTEGTASTTVVASTSPAPFLDRLKARANAATATSARPVPVGNFDKILDGILLNAADRFRKTGVDPLKLGSLGPCQNCRVEGLSLVKRSGPSFFTFNDDTAVANIAVHVTLPATYLNCQRCYIRLLHFPLGGEVEFSIWNLAVYVNISQTLQEGERPTLNEFRVEDEGEINLTINGHGVVAPVVNAAVHTIGRPLVSKLYGRLLRDLAPVLIRNQLKNFNLPLG